MQKDETLAAAFARLTDAELGVALALEDAAFYGVWQHFYDDNFFGTDFTSHYVVLSFRLRLDGNAQRLPRAQHAAYRWQTHTALLAADDVHDNSRAYFRAGQDIGVPQR